MAHIVVRLYRNHVSYNNHAECLFLQAVIALMEMGFDEKEVIDALRVNNNQQDAAVRMPVHSGVFAVIACSLESMLNMICQNVCTSWCLSCDFGYIYDP